MLSHSVVPHFLRPHGLQPTRLLCLWSFLRKNIGVGCHFLLQGIFQAQGSNLRLLGLPHCQVGSLPPVPSGKPHFCSRRTIKLSAHKFWLLPTSRRDLAGPISEIVISAKSSVRLLRYPGASEKFTTQGSQSLTLRVRWGLVLMKPCLQKWEDWAKKQPT